MEKESCPICWRVFGSTNKPHSLPCGHSYCLECVNSIHSCSLCRSRLPRGYVAVVNYSLLSVLEKTEKVQRVETSEKTIQTEDWMNIQPVANNQTTNTQPIQQASRRRKKKQAIQFKFDRDHEGNMKVLEFALM